MLKKQAILLLLIFLISLIKAQSINKGLIQAHSFQFHQTIYVYGYEQQQTNLLFKCFAYNQSLQLKDSIAYNLGKHTTADFLETTIDTLHDVINFYFQLANEKNVVTLLRLNDSLQKIGGAENYDANHINSMMTFGDD
jgi:hypothetical protein